MTEGNVWDFSRALLENWSFALHDHQKKNDQCKKLKQLDNEKSELLRKYGSGRNSPFSLPRSNLSTSRSIQPVFCSLVWEALVPCTNTYYHPTYVQIKTNT